MHRLLILSSRRVRREGCTRRPPTNRATPRRRCPAGVGQLPAPEVVPTKFAMVGDSITKASTETLTEALPTKGFTRHHIEAEVSRRIAVGDGRGEPLSGVKTLFTMISEGVSPTCGPSRWGPTMSASTQTREEYADLIDQMMPMPDAGVPILWVDVYHPNQMPGTKMFNKVLRERAKARATPRCCRGSMWRRTLRRRSCARTTSTPTRGAPWCLPISFLVRWPDGHRS